MRIMVRSAANTQTVDLVHRREPVCETDSVCTGFALELQLPNVLRKAFACAKTKCITHSLLPEFVVCIVPAAKAC